MVLRKFLKLAKLGVNKPKYLTENQENHDNKNRKLPRKNLGIDLQTETGNNDSRAQLADIGSTCRHTNTPEDFDLDFSLKLSVHDFSRITEIARGLENVMVFTKEFFYQEAAEYYQLRLKGLACIGQQKIDKPIKLDISFVSPSVSNEYRAHDAICDKLDYIKKHYGRSAYEQTIANIILTKQILKEKHAYKNGKEGGFCGLGVENWLLASGGNMEKAFSDFRTAVYENGQPLTLEKFREKYKILSGGLTNVYNIYDNFIDILKPNGYQSILEVIEDYFKTNNLD